MRDGIDGPFVAWFSRFDGWEAFSFDTIEEAREAGPVAIMTVVETADETEPMENYACLTADLIAQEALKIRELSQLLEIKQRPDD